MPIPEPGAYRPSNLTKKQQQEQLAAVYGVPMQTQQLTEVEAAQMRQILARHDSESKPVQIHDLNRPPQAPYRFQKFPMMVYDLENSYPSRDEDQARRNGMGIESVHIPAKVVSAIVNSEDELEQLLATGWSEQAPAFSEEREETLSAKYQNEANRVDEQIEAKRSKRRAA